MCRCPPSERVRRIGWGRFGKVDDGGKRALSVGTCGVPWVYILAC